MFTKSNSEIHANMSKHIFSFLMETGKDGSTNMSNSVYQYKLIKGEYEKKIQNLSIYHSIIASLRKLWKDNLANSMNIPRLVNKILTQFLRNSNL